MSWKCADHRTSTRKGFVLLSTCDINLKAFRVRNPFQTSQTQRRDMKNWFSFLVLRGFLIVAIHCWWYFQECVFNKLSPNTGLRVYWNGALRIYNCHACCRRWYFTFNDVECSAPAAIEGLVYMVHGNGSKKNLHRVRQIEGVCEKVPPGNVRVGFWVGNCQSVKSADAYTGWNSVSRIYVEEVPPPQD